MSLLRYTLVSEGSSDQALIPLITWAIQQCADLDLQPTWADLRRLSRPPRELSARIQTAIELYPCDLLFVHRDADRLSRSHRTEEIDVAIQRLQIRPRAVCVIPIRCTEAWFLFDEEAIRRAAGNPNGKSELNLPRLGTVEKLPYPKSRLHQTLRLASELAGRRRRRFDPDGAVHRIARLIRDYSPLRGLPAFGAFEKELKQALASLENGRKK